MSYLVSNQDGRPQSSIAQNALQTEQQRLTSVVPGGPPLVGAPFGSLATGADNNNRNNTIGVNGAHQTINLRDSTVGGALKSGFSAFGLGN